MNTIQALKILPSEISPAHFGIQSDNLKNSFHRPALRFGEEENKNYREPIDWKSFDVMSSTRQHRFDRSQVSPSAFWTKEGKENNNRCLLACFFIWLCENFAAGVKEFHRLEAAFLKKSNLFASQIHSQRVRTFTARDEEPVTSRSRNTSWSRYCCCPLY